MGLERQNLTRKQKIKIYGSEEAWGKQVLDSFDTDNFYYSFDNIVDKDAMRVNMDLSNGIFDSSDFKRVIHPYGEKDVDVKFPTELEHYDRITTKLNLLKGEEIKRPFSYMVVSDSRDTVSMMHDQKQQMLMQYYSQMILQQLGIQQGQDGSLVNAQGQPVNTPEQIEKYMAYTYKDNREDQGNNALKYLVRNLRIDQLFHQGWHDFLVTGTEMYHSYLKGEEPCVRKVNPLYIDCDVYDDLVFLDECSWIREVRYIPVSEVYDEFYDVLTEKDVEILEQYKSGIDTDIALTPHHYPLFNKGANTHIRLIHLEWKSLKKIGFLTMMDPETGQMIEEMVDEDFVLEPEMKELGAVVEWRWVNIVWEGTKIGKSIYLNVRAKPFQYKKLSNVSECKLSYTGVITKYGFMDKLKPYQYLFNIIMYKLNLALTTSIGNVFVMDIAQIPNSAGITLDKWIALLKHRLALVNSQEEGAKGRIPSNFNQFQSLDLGAGNEITMYLETLAWIDRQLGSISGVTLEREGQVSQTETLGGVERSVSQSSHITEPYFNLHNEVKRRTLTMLLEVAKVAWRNGKQAQMVFDDMGRTFFQLDEGFVDSEYGVFVSNTAKDFQILESIKQLAQGAMQSGMATLKDIVEIMEANDIISARKILEASQSRMEQNAQQQQQAEQQMAQEQMAHAMEMEQAKRDHEIQLHQMDNDTKIEIEKMKNDKEGEIALEQSKLEMEREKLAAEIDALQVKTEADAEKNMVEREKLESETNYNIEDIKIRKEEIQVEREKIKAEFEKMQLEIQIKQKELEMKMVELEMKKQELQMKLEATAMELQLKKEGMQMEMEMGQQKAQADMQIQKEKGQTDIQVQQMQHQNDMQMQSQQHEADMAMNKESHAADMKMKKDKAESKDSKK